MKAWIKLALAGLAALVVGQLLVPRSPARLQPGKAAPPFTLRSTGGVKVELASLQGQVVLVNFWATWCPPCLRELPELSAARQAAGGGCLEVLGVVEESASADVMAAAKQLPYPVLLDPRATVAAAWGVSAYPRSFLIDREGRLARVFEGPLNQRQLEEAAAPLMAPGCQGPRP
jgi:peroxiredoxin